MKPAGEEFGRFDLLLDGRYVSWLRFANSLRMRLASAAPALAAAEFRKAVENPYGVFESSAENAAVSTAGVYINPLGEINRNWNEAAMNAVMESILTGYGDPRIGK